MRVLFLLRGPFACRSGVQIFHFANGLTARGWDVAVAGRGNPTSVESIGVADFEALRLHEVGEAIQRWGAGPDLIHAWTPRERVRRLATKTALDHGLPYIVHLEDDEPAILGAQLGVRAESLDPETLEGRIDADSYHPVRGRAFLRGASGVTVTADGLRDYVLGDQPWMRLHPCLDAARFSTDGRDAVRRRLGILDGEFIVVYPGNMHAANREDMFSLYLSIALLRRRGHPARLLRLGTDYEPGLDRSWELLKSNVISIGSVPWSQVPEYLAAGDAFVQPGHLNRFNRNRMPTKLPEFLATGLPTVLPACNIGLELTDGKQALLLGDGGATEIADRLEEVISDPGRAAAIGAAGREFALEAFDPGTILDELESFYGEVLGGWNEREALRSLLALRGPRTIAPRRDPVPLWRRRLGRLRPRIPLRQG
jgi:glycosyltransferase involved in cell wall biosynthesis